MKPIAMREKIGLAALILNKRFCVYWTNDKTNYKLYERPKTQLLIVGELTKYRRTLPLTSCHCIPTFPLHSKTPFM